MKKFNIIIIMNVAIKVFLLMLLCINFLFIIPSCKKVSEDKIDIKQNEKEITETINNVFSWAVNKDFDLFFKTIANDSNFISVTPYNRVKFGIADVKKDSAFWGSPDFKAISHQIRNLKIRISKSCDIAWFYCNLDDINEWKGEPANWINARWTGVLEKRNVKWIIVQQHFSFPKEK